ncbi:MAG: hypothetical protein HRU38_15355 [Saccharospirillaceae bacterium]|nr:hypothetical protein [Pseudomonadales bacterium]NRB80018.1 hypothetical protein [Saccharospirillaceae bacterium]
MVDVGSEYVISLAVLFAGLYSFCSIFIKKIRSKWAGTNIITGTISNLGFGLFFTYGSFLTLFVPLPFENFFVALIFGIIPLVGSWFVGFKGYRIDMKKHKNDNKVGVQPNKGN